jgi:DNA-binding IclR family transcriptional regulator
MAILSLFSPDKVDLSLDEISVSLGLAKSTAHRLLKTLEEAGYVQASSRYGSYRLGMQSVLLGSGALASLGLRDEVNRTLNQICELTGETVGMSVLHQDVAVVVARANGSHALRYHHDVGSRLPAFCTSAGKVLLADLDHSKIEHLRSRVRPRQPGDAIAAELRNVRERGYAVDNEEFLPGLRCISVPVRDTAGATRYSLGISAPAARLTAADLLTFVPLLQQTARRMQPYVMVPM